ncbi:hypothetical protein ICN48_10730 [Polynucleobacter sp. JS-Safj-400b-B2]|uniref:hypothetical protein n=1 Tax=Polynucleobacter sp. JS-Safj-400b-B2 TaxID=2576921 RepID=UPI001C0BBB55|nr:hypothetical protein [Polynucleobacter sp. JS-Safj-400b-B2]MBU3626705.1 hypothetical protein [Polynucleobacter sp. JS-Safj-400b-B2]
MKYQLQTRLTLLAVQLAITGVVISSNAFSADVAAGQALEGGSGPIDQNKIKQNTQKPKLEPLRSDPNALLMGKSKTNATPKDSKDVVKEDVKVDVKEQKPNPFGGSEVGAAPTTKDGAASNRSATQKASQSATQKADDESHINPMTGKTMSVEDLDMRLAKTTKLALIAEQEKRIRELTPAIPGVANTQGASQGNSPPAAPIQAQAQAQKIPTLSKKEKLALEKMEKERRAQAAMPPPAQYPQLVGLMNQSGRTMAMISLGGETVVVGKGEMVYGRHIDAVDDRGVIISGMRIGLNNALEATRFTSVDEQKVPSAGAGNNGTSGTTAVSAIARVSTSSTINADGTSGQNRIATGAGAAPNYSGPMPAPLGSANPMANTGSPQVSTAPTTPVRNSIVPGSISGANIPSSPSANNPAN